MKKILIAAIVSMFFSAYSQNETDMSLKINNAKMSFYATSTPPDGDVENIFGIRLWELGRGKEAKMCVRFGICGDQSIVSPPIDFTDEGRQVTWKVSNDELNHLTSVNVYFREDVSSIAPNELIFNVNQDVLIQNNLYFQSGSYPFNSGLGQYGGFTINLIRK